MPRDLPEFDDYDIEFELTNSEDGFSVILHCHSSRELTPDEYAQALIAFARRMTVLGELNEETATMN